jgi:hypothetical protein
MHDICVEKNTNLWNNKFCLNFEWTNEISKFMTKVFSFSNKPKTLDMNCVHVFICVILLVW